MKRSQNKNTLKRVATLEGFFRRSLSEEIIFRHVELSKSKHTIAKELRGILESLGEEPKFSPGRVLEIIEESGIEYRDGFAWKKERIEAIENFYSMSLETLIRTFHLEEGLNLYAI